MGDRKKKILEYFMKNYDEERILYSFFFRPKAYFLADLVDYFYRCMRYDGVRKTHITPFFK